MALFWCRPDLREQLRLTQFGWHMVEDMGDFDRKDWRPAADARRFECGSPNLLGAHALEASLSLLQETGMPAVAEAIDERTARLIELMDAQGLELLSPREVGRRAGIVTFRVPGAYQQALYKALMGCNLMCASRGGGLRFSPHFYTPRKKLCMALALLER